VLPGSIQATTPSATLLPARAYHDEALYAWEMDEIFLRDWVMVAREEEIPDPGSFVQREVLGENVLLVRGRDENYVAAARMGRLFVDFDEDGWPLEKRVARHLTAVREVVNSYNDLHPDAPIVIDGIPGYDELIAKGLGVFLQPPP